MEQDIRDSILEYLLEKKTKQFTSEDLSKKYKKPEDEINIIIDLIVKQEINGSDIIGLEIFDNNSYLIWCNKYTKYFLEAGGFTAIQKQKEDDDKYAIEKQEQEQRIRDKTESNLEATTKLAEYQHRFRHLDTANKLVSFIIQTKGILIVITSLASYGLVRIVIWLLTSRW